MIDFGISRALEGTALTATGVQVGTAGFMALQQADGREITAAADVFALGCLLAYAATLIDRAARRRTIVHVQLLLAPLLLILAIVILLGGHHSSPSTLNSPDFGPGVVTDHDAADTSTPGTTPNNGLSPSDGGNSPASAPISPANPAGSSVPVAASSQAAANSPAGKAVTTPPKATTSAAPPPGPITTAPAPPAARFSFDNGTQGWGRAKNSDIAVAAGGGITHDGPGSLQLTDTAVNAGTYILDTVNWN